MAIAQVGASLGYQTNLSPISPLSQKDADALRNVDGLIGIAQKVHELDHVRSQTRLAPHIIDSASELNDTELQHCSKEPCESEKEQLAGVRLGIGTLAIIT